MGDAVSDEPKTIASGGFRIEIRPDELTVTRDTSAWLPVNRSALIRTLRVILFAVLASALVLEVLSGPTGSDFSSLGIFALIILMGVLIGSSQGDNNLNCTRESLDVISVSRGKVRRKRSFPRDAVRKIRFAPVRYSQYGSTCGLIFDVDGKKVKILAGLESPEAQTILKELGRLGFDVEHGIGMPMMVEMTLERRNSWFGH